MNLFHHTATLSDDTPKSRRRVRALLSLTKETSVTPSHIASARAKAIEKGRAKPGAKK